MEHLSPYQTSIRERDRLIRALRDVATKNKSIIIDYLLFHHHMREVTEQLTLECANTIGHVEMVNSHADDFNGGPQIAELISVSDNLGSVQLFYNHFTEKTLFAIARALVTNTSVSVLQITRDNCQSFSMIEDAFVFALQLNPMRDPRSVWMLPRPDDDEQDDAYGRLKARADALGHPTMLALLVHVHEPFNRFMARIH